MAEKVIVEYELKFVNGEKVVAGIQNVGEELDDLKAKAQAAFAGGAIESATNELIQQGNVVEALVTEYGSATKALKAMEKELQTMAALGQRNTKEFKQLAKATAELKDSVGDTRGEIKKMASDTRVFDTMVQGARGVAAAFSVATGLAASLGDENKDLQKTLLKVQGAMAALQGVQELANIATEKGGIATKAYGVALQVVDKISKVTGLSMAASWALATAGISVVIAGVVYLISQLDDATDATDELTEAEERRKEKIKERSDTESIANTKQANELKKLEVAYKLALLSAKDRNEELEIEIQYRRDAAATLYQQQVGLENLLTQIDKNVNNGFEYNKVNEKILDTQIKYIEVMEKVKTAEKELADIRSKLPKRQTAIENVTTNTTVTKLATVATLPDLTKLPNNDAALKEYAESKADRDKKIIQSAYFNLAESSIIAINTVFASIQENQIALVNAQFDAQTASLNKWQQKALDSAGDNAEKRSAIERSYARRQEVLQKQQAIKEAQIRRQGAIYEKFSAVFSIGLNAAKSITAVLSDSTIPQIAKPALIAANAAISGAALAAALAKPLPPVPKFEKGGKVKVLGGGRSNDGMLYGRSHREGGMLIEAQGGEYIWDIPTVKKHGDIIQAAHENKIENLVFHKYIAPQMKKGQAQQENYDDFMLRVAVKNSARDSADRIVNGIVRGLKNDGYLMSRYG